MSPTTAMTTRALGNMFPSDQVPAAERAAYVYVGNGKFEPANDAAWREVERWNSYADVWNARTATRSGR